MEKTEKTESKKSKKDLCAMCPCSDCGCKRVNGRGEAVYGLGMIGAFIYYIQGIPDFWAFLFAVAKAIFWPAFVVYELLKHLNMA